MIKGSRPPISRIVKFVSQDPRRLVNIEKGNPRVEKRGKLHARIDVIFEFSKGFHIYIYTYALRKEIAW